MLCPICRRKPDTAYRPFCSKRCADIDLGRWLSDVYVVPGSAEDPVPSGDADPSLTESE